MPEDIDTDLDGNPRFVDDPDTADTGNGAPPIVDMGAYEFQLPCPWDLNGDGEVNVADLLLLLVVDLTDLRLVPLNFGPCDGCPEDVNGDGVFDVEDVIAVAMHFGPCP